LISYFNTRVDAIARWQD